MPGGMVAKVQSAISATTLLYHWGQQRPRLPDSLLHRIAVVTCIPDFHKQRIFGVLKQIVSVAAYVEYFSSLRWSNAAQRQLAQIALHAESLADQIRQLDKAALEVLESSLCESDEWLVLTPGDMSIVEYCEALIRELSRAASVRVFFDRPRHRPRNRVKYFALNYLIGGLYRVIVSEANGRLTLGQDSAKGRLNGTLPDVLELLQPYIPRIVPTNLNFSMLQRPLSKARSILRNV
jgi:hypothetical protein